MMILVCIQVVQTRSGRADGFSTPRVLTIRSKPSLSQKPKLLFASNPSFDMESGSDGLFDGLQHPDGAHDSDKTTPTVFSNAAEWHRQRRKQMIQKYGDQILPLEDQRTSSYNVGIPLLLAGNLCLLGLSLWSARLSLSWVFGLALFPGSILSLWQLQILHD
ncbi:MAG: hypothetical protein SGBAC_006425, partial [Bacillariaceae sp.]